MSSRGFETIVPSSLLSDAAVGITISFFKHMTSHIAGPLKDKTFFRSVSKLEVLSSLKYCIPWQFFLYQVKKHRMMNQHRLNGLQKI